MPHKGALSTFEKDRKEIKRERSLMAVAAVLIPYPWTWLLLFAFSKFSFIKKPTLQNYNSCSKVK